MATRNEIANTVSEMRAELARRIDELVAGGDMTRSGAACVGGVLEWLVDLEHAMRHCDGVPSVPKFLGGDKE